MKLMNILICTDSTLRPAYNQFNLLPPIDLPTTLNQWRIWVGEGGSPTSALLNFKKYLHSNEIQMKRAANRLQ